MTSRPKVKAVCSSSRLGRVLRGTSAPFVVRLFKESEGVRSMMDLMAKKNFYELAYHVPREDLNEEIGQKLDSIVAVAIKARSAGETQ